MVGSLEARTLGALDTARTPKRSAADRAAVLAELRAELAARPTTAGVAGRAVPTLPALPAFVDLLPDRGLRRGASYTVEGSTMLGLGLVAGASRAGSWCGLVGLPTLGAEAATGLGVDLSRLALVPSPGRQWLGVVAALIDVLDVVLVRPPTPAYDAEARRLAARVRERGAVLVVQGSDWSGSELRLSITSSTWHGLGSGHGHLTSREVTVEATGRGTGGRRRTSRLWLPDQAGGISPALTASPVSPVSPVTTDAATADTPDGDVIPFSERRLERVS
ncbi:hypothetical protein [Actinopolymorpha pittospori]